MSQAFHLIKKAGWASSRRRRHVPSAPRRSRWAARGHVSRCRLVQLGSPASAPLPNATTRRVALVSAIAEAAACAEGGAVAATSNGRSSADAARSSASSRDARGEIAGGGGVCARPCAAARRSRAPRRASPLDLAGEQGFASCPRRARALPRPSVAAEHLLTSLPLSLGALGERVEHHVAGNGPARGFLDLGPRAARKSTVAARCAAARTWRRRSTGCWAGSARGGRSRRGLRRRPITAGGKLRRAPCRLERNRDLVVRPACIGGVLPLVDDDRCACTSLDEHLESVRQPVRRGVPVGRARRSAAAYWSSRVEHTRF